jgi:hypothetical protein
MATLLICEHIKIKTYNTINLLVISYGHETLPLILKEEHKFRVQNFDC